MLKQLLVVVAVFLLALSPFILLGLRSKKSGKTDRIDYKTTTWY